MLKLPIKYKDFNDEDCQDIFFFNLSKAELIRLNFELGEDGDQDLGATMKRIVQSDDKRKMIKMFETFVLRSYGIRSEDGRKFTKSEEATKEFQASPAYDELFLKLVTDAKYAAMFVNGIMPSDLVKQALEDADTPAEYKEIFKQATEPPKPIEKKGDGYTQAEVDKMSPEELKALVMGGLPK